MAGEPVGDQGDAGVGRMGNVVVENDCCGVGEQRPPGGHVGGDTGFGVVAVEVEQTDRRFVPLGGNVGRKSSDGGDTVGDTGGR